MSEAIQVRMLYPKFLVIIFVALGYVSTGVAGLDDAFPAIEVMLIFYWSLYRPSLMQNWFVLLVGVVTDVLSGVSIGVNALVNLILRNLVVWQSGRLLDKNVNVVWVVFALIYSVIVLVKWLFFSFIYGSFFSGDVVVLQWVLTVILYPVFHMLFNVVHSILPRNMEHAK